jgi:acyl-CoA thioesterase-2
VFGGQVLGQALAAAQATVDPARSVHSLHAYFLRAGDIGSPIVYDVDRTRDGGSFSVRRVTAIQHGKVIFFCAASFQQAEDGAEHQHRCRPCRCPKSWATTTPPRPSGWPPCRESAALALAQRALRVPPRHPRNELNPPKRAPFHQVWLRLTEPVGDDPQMHQALLAYASDFHLLGTATLPHAISYYQPDVQMASLDHALWFHRPFRPTTGCCIRWTAPPRRARAGCRAGSSSPATACWWPARRRKA